MCEELKCPKCGAEHYRHDGSISTLLGTYAEYKDGKTIYRDPNITTDQFTCLECGEQFEIEHRNENERTIGYPERPLLRCNPMEITVSDAKEALDAFNRLKAICQGVKDYSDNSMKIDADLDIIERFIRERI